MTGNSGLMLSHNRVSQYRADIDGLRAIAVISVVIFHFEKTWLAGGFLGVDIFFVISGYLITNILVREVLNGKFSIIKFYERRVRRIAPALFFFLLVLIFASTVLLIPADLMGFAKSLIAVVWFVANFYFWQDGDYFARSSEYKPLLHMWTLSVEEQFYIFFPLIVATLGKRKAWLPLALVIFIIVCSFSANVLALHVGARLPAFYLLPTRAWELGLGALVATIPQSCFGRPVQKAAGLPALALMIYGIWYGDNGVPTFLPAALPAVLGSALYIWSGVAIEDRGFVHQALSSRIPVFIGLISFSLYLWHWPISVFYHYYFMQSFTLLPAIFAFTLMIAVATLSWRFIERPFRDKRFSSAKIFKMAGLAAGVAVSTGAALVYFDGFPSRMSTSSNRLAAASGTNYRCPLNKIVAFGARNACLLTTPTIDGATTVLLGNSHAQMYAPMIADALKKRGRSLLLVPANGCAPLVGVNISTDCIRIAEDNIAGTTKLKHVSVVILALQWNVYDKMVDANGKVPNEPKQAMVLALDRAISEIKASGKHVVLVGPIQKPDYDFPSVMSRSLAFGRHLNLAQSIPLKQFMNEFGPILDHYRKRADITFITPHTVQCASGQCQFSLNGNSLFADDNHLAVGQLNHFQPVFDQAFANLSKP